MNDEPESVTDLCRRLGWARKTTLKYLHRLHEKHGGLLFRYSEAPNAKLWVDAAALERIRMGESPEANQLAALNDRLDQIEGKADQALRQVRQLRRAATR